MPNEGLYASGATWRQLHNFTASSVALILASGDYEIDTYTKGFNEL